MVLCVLAMAAFLIFYKLFREFGRTQNVIINVSEEDREKLKNVIDGIIAKQYGNPDSSGNPELDRVTEALREQFPDFTPSSFLSKAEEMFDSIFNAFANSHHYLLKSMLTERLYESFASKIERREARNLRQELLVKHLETSLSTIRVIPGKVQILVTFVISQMSAMVNSDGISFDNPKRLYRDVVYRWIFERAFGKDNWILAKISVGNLEKEYSSKAIEDK